MALIQEDELKHFLSLDSDIIMSSLDLPNTTG